MKALLKWFLVAFLAATLPGVLEVRAGAGEPFASSTTNRTVWPVTVTRDRKAFVGADGRLVLFVGDTAWSLIVGPRNPDVLTYLDDRAARGVNLIVVNLIEHSFSEHDPPWKNAYGIAPFRNPNDFTTTIDAYFDHAEWVVAEAQKRGIGVLLAPSYIGASCGAEGWCAEMRRSGAARLEAYGRFLGRRFAKHPNVIWMHSGDHEPADEDLKLVEAIRRGIATAAGGKTLTTYHYQPDVPPAADDRLKRIDFDTLYSYDVGFLGDFVLWGRERNKGARPVVFIEGVYENEYQSRPQDWREQFYVTMVGGGAGFVFGNNPMWKFAPPWKEELASEGAKSLQVAGRFFRSLPWKSLTPEAGRRIIVDGLGDPGETGYAIAGANPARTLVVAYFTQRRTVTVAADRMAGSFRAQWFDPSTGRYRAIAGSPFARKGRITFTPPPARADGSADWVLVLEASRG